MLEVPLTADEREVKKSYRRKIVSVHPDKNGQAAHSDEAFDRVRRSAFATLSDVNERMRYEASLVEAYRRAAMSERAGGFAGGGGGERAEGAGKAERLRAEVVRPAR